jgi:hypothetical protein
MLLATATTDAAAGPVGGERLTTGRGGGDRGEDGASETEIRQEKIIKK